MKTILWLGECEGRDKRTSSERRPLNNFQELCAPKQLERCSRSEAPGAIVGEHWCSMTLPHVGELRLGYSGCSAHNQATLPRVFPFSERRMPWNILLLHFTYWNSHRSIVVFVCLRQSCSSSTALSYVRGESLFPGKECPQSSRASLATCRKT